MYIRDLTQKSRRISIIIPVFPIASGFLFLAAINPIIDIPGWALLTTLSPETRPPESSRPFPVCYGSPGVLIAVLEKIGMEGDRSLGIVVEGGAKYRILHIEYLAFLC